MLLLNISTELHTESMDVAASWYMCVMLDYVMFSYAPYYVCLDVPSNYSSE